MFDVRRSIFSLLRPSEITCKKTDDAFVFVATPIFEDEHEGEKMVWNSNSVQCIALALEPDTPAIHRHPPGWLVQGKSDRLGEQRVFDNLV